MDSVICHYTGGYKDPEGNITCTDPNGCYCGKDSLYMLLLTIPALPICWIETYSMLSYFSMFGIGMAIIGMLVMFGMLGNKLAKDEEVKGDLKVFDFFAFFGNIGVAMFVFEGNAVVINVRSEAKNQNKYGRILTSAIMTILTIFMIFSTFGYYVYKDE